MTRATDGQYRNIRFELDGSIATLTFDQPETRNAISDADMIEEIVHALSSIPTRPEISVLIVTGAGKAFSSGGNVKKMRERGGIFAGGALDVQQSYRTGIQRIPLQLYELEVPVIAAVNGAAIGAGFDISLMCDIRLASTEAKFGETFLNLGIIPGDGGAWFLPRALGHQRAAELTFTGRIVEAQEALDLGIVLEVVEPEQLLPRADIATPNRYELEWLTGASLDSPAAIMEAARTAGPGMMLVTSAPASGPDGIGAPVKMRIAVPRTAGPSRGCPAVTRPAIGSAVSPSAARSSK